MRKKKGHATEAKGWNFFELLRRIGFVLIGIMTLALGIGVGGSSFGAEVVFVNAPRESWPQEKLTFGTDLTFRYETLDNFNCSGYGKDVPAGKEDDSIYLGRVRAGANYTPSEKVRFSLWGYQANAWDHSVPKKTFYNPVFGCENNSYEDRLELYKAYIEIRPVTQFKIKLGRQRLDYGDFRTFGLCNWANNGPYLWDAVKLSYDFGKNNFIDAFYGRIKMNDPKNFSLNHRHSYEGVGVYSRFFLPILNAHIEPFFAYKGDDTDKYKEELGGVGTLNEYYTGARLWGRDVYNFDYDLWASKEFGRRGSDDIDAYAYHALGGYNFKGLWAKPRLSLEYTYSSGDDDPDDGDHETFDVGYGVWGAWHGNQWSFFKWRNFQDLQVNLELWPVEGVHMVFGLHNYWLAEKEDAWYMNPHLYRDPSGDSGRKVGETFDVTANLDLSKIFPHYSLLKGHRLSCTYGHFFPSEVVRNRADENSGADWFYIQWSYKYSWKIL